MPLGRPKTFREVDVLEPAMRLFWRLGYERVTLTQLTRTMGIARQSLYDTFGDKRRLFIQTLYHYRTHYLAPILEALDQDRAPYLDQIRTAVTTFQCMALNDDQPGCFVANTLLDLSGSADDDLRALLSETLGLLECSLHRTLIRARHAGELTPKKEPRILSRALTNSLIGMAALSKLHPSKDVISDIYAGTLRILD